MYLKFNYGLNCRRVHGFVHTAAGNDDNGTSYNCALTNPIEEKFGEEKSIEDARLN